MSISSCLTTGKSLNFDVSGYMPRDIQKDPPASKFTRPRYANFMANEQVADITKNGLDRFNEVVLKYERNVNPQVSVMYGDADTSNSALPYKLDEAVYRLTKADLRQEGALSRSRYATVPAFTGKASKFYPLYEINVTDADDVNEVISDKLNVTDVTAAKTFEPRPNPNPGAHARAHIQDPVRACANSRKKPNRIAPLVVGEPTKEIICPLHYSVTAPHGNSQHQKNNAYVDTDAYINLDNLTVQNVTAPVLYGNQTHDDARVAFVSVIDPLLTTDVTAGSTGGKSMVKYIHEAPALERCAPLADRDTAIYVGKTPINDAPQVSLSETLTLGGFDGRGNYVPQF